MGIPDIAAFWKGAMNTGIKEAKLETREIEKRSDLAVEIGEYTLTIEAQGGTVTDVGKYVVVWKDDDGAWKLCDDIWNSNVAA